jgi:transposase
VLSDADRAVLEERVRSYTAPFAVVVRARIVLLAAERMMNVDIAERLGVDADTVSKWRKRFVMEGLAGLKERRRSGRPRRFAAEVVAAVKAMACEPPEARAVPLSRWSSAELAVQAVAEGLTVSVSASTVRRWLAADAIKPWQHRSWIFPRDPDFSIARMRAAWPTATLVHLPVHASWLNQIEVVFSVIQRKVIKPADFADLDTLADRLVAFEPRYNAAATPFDWTFTRTDLDDLIRRIDAHRAERLPAAAG